MEKLKNEFAKKLKESGVNLDPDTALKLTIAELATDGVAIFGANTIIGTATSLAVNCTDGRLKKAVIKMGGMVMSLAINKSIMNTVGGVFRKIGRKLEVKNGDPENGLQETSDEE